MKKFMGILLIASGFTIASASAQTSRDYSKVDEQVKAMGAMTHLNVASITDTITRIFPDKTDKLRAIYYWISNNIQLDPRATKNVDTRPVLPEDVVEKRKTSSLGIATLVQEMSSLANIRCLVVDGYLKHGTDHINEEADEPNHSWNVIQLGQSPEQWFYLDASCAAGTFDDRLTLFTPAFTGGYFFADKPFFNQSHFPDNKAWQLDIGPKGLKNFYEMPVIDPAATDLGFTSISPTDGWIKVKIKKPIAFSFKHNGDSSIQKVEFIIGQSRKYIKPTPIVYTDAQGTLSFTHSFAEADEYPVKIMINDRVCFRYVVEVKE